MEASGRGRAGPRSQCAAPGRRPAWLRGLMSGRPPAAAVPAGETVEPPPPPPLHLMYVAVVAFVLLFFVGCGVLLSRKRRRQHGQLWFPEGFKVSEASKKKRREPLGEDSVGLKSVDVAGRLGGGQACGRRGCPLPSSAAPPGALGMRGAWKGRGISVDPRSRRLVPSPPGPVTPRPLKNSSDGALMDDNQNEWGDEGLEAKKFRVSRGSRVPAPPCPAPRGVTLCPTPFYSSRSPWSSLTWTTRQTTGSGPSSTWTPPTCECLPWPPRLPRARRMPTAWT